MGLYRRSEPAGLVRATLPAECEVEQINYYTAHVSGRVDPDAPNRQNTYLRALRTLSTVTPFFGQFLAKPVWAGLVQPLDFRPIYTPPADVELHVAKVWKTEEKGSDVNLATHLLWHAMKDRFEVAAVLTSDSDLTETLRIVAQEIGKPVILLVPSSYPTGSLAAVVHEVRHIRPYLGVCQFANPVIVEGRRRRTEIRKPPSW